MLLKLYPALFREYSLGSLDPPSEENLGPLSTIKAPSLEKNLLFLLVTPMFNSG